MKLERQRRSNAEVPSCDAACGTKGGDSVSATGHGAPPPQSSIPVQIPRMPLFENMDPDIIPEFRPRLGTEVESINDSGYNSSFHDSVCYEQQQQYPGAGPQYVPGPPPPFPPGPGFPGGCGLWLYSPATNTLIPCEEVIVAQTIQSGPGGPVYQAHTKAYVAYPVQVITLCFSFTSNS